MIVWGLGFSSGKYILGFSKIDLEDSQGVRFIWIIRGKIFRPSSGFVFVSSILHCQMRILGEYQSLLQTANL